MFHLFMVDGLFMWLYSYNVLKEYLVCQQIFIHQKIESAIVSLYTDVLLFFEIACLQ